MDFVSLDERLTATQLAALSPDLVVVAFGTNEAYNFRPEQLAKIDEELTLADRIAAYRADFERLLARYRRAAPAASCLVLLPPDLAPTRDEMPCIERQIEGVEEPVCVPEPLASMVAVVAAQRSVARQSGCAVWDQTVAMGGPGSIRIWSELEPRLAGGDGIHLTMDGYDALGDRLFDDLLGAFDRYKKGHRAELTTTPIPLPEKESPEDGDEAPDTASTP
jgi:lysophospholipase L1-like esterase